MLFTSLTVIGVQSLLTLSLHKNPKMNIFAVEPYAAIFLRLAFILSRCDTAQ